eukprot:s5155_g5.t1
MTFSRTSSEVGAVFTQKPSKSAAVRSPFTSPVSEPYQRPQPVQLLAWPFHWRRLADRHGGRLGRTTLLLPWHLSQDIWIS